MHLESFFNEKPNNLASKKEKAANIDLNGVCGNIVVT